jgi:mannan endo-1,4-beta-mannosidase
LGVAGIKVSELPNFDEAVGVRPNIVEIYTTFRDPLDSGRLSAIILQNALPLIQLNPTGISLKDIVVGDYDTYLERYAAGIKDLNHQVALSFAPEANGDWYSWGCGRSSAALYIAAWRHIYDVMTNEGASKIIWVWDVNDAFPGSCPVASRWPGAGYVTWTAIDGYGWYLGETFANILEPTVRRISGFTRKPVIIAETGAPDGPEAVPWINSLFAGVEAMPDVIGIVWSNYQDKYGDNRLQDDPAALKAFQQQARAYMR